MATHESWQFSNVGDIGATCVNKVRLASSAPLVVEFSNLIEGTVPSDEQPLLSVLASEGISNHIRINYSIPSDLSDFTLTGRLKVLKKTKEFPRDVLDASATEIISEDFSSTIGILARNEYTLLLDYDYQDSKNIWYYTIFYEGVTDGGDTKWGFSSIHSHGRAFALEAQESRAGLKAFEYMPKGIKILDKREADDALYRFLQILGKPLDEIEDRLNKFAATRHDPNEVDAHLIPYLDQLLGWPTNFKISEARRRKETGNAVDVWKRKSANDALELAIQTVTGWDAEFVEGYKYILRTATYEDAIDYSSEPAGWDENVDGDWTTLVQSRPFNGTVDTTNISTINLQNASSRSVCVMPDFSENSWVNTFGVLVNLIRSFERSSLQSAKAIEEVRRLLPYLGIHYAQFAIGIYERFQEVIEIIGNDVHSDLEQEAGPVSTDGNPVIIITDNYTDN